MLCDECNEREATCMVTIVADGEQIKRHLCPQCLSKIHGALGQTLPGAIGIGVAGLQVTNLLSSILSAITSVGEENKKEEGPDKICPRCRTTLHAFQKSGHLGCPECYQVFREELQRRKRCAQKTLRRPQRSVISCGPWQGRRQSEQSHSDFLPCASCKKLYGFPL